MEFETPLEEAFAGCVGRWRVVDKGDEPGRGGDRRFAIMGLPVGCPLDRTDAEFELCAVQYKPHAEAIAALPELAFALSIAEAGLKKTVPVSKEGLARIRGMLEALEKARTKAEGRA
jgi:hypothetical protein